MSVVVSGPARDVDRLELQIRERHPEAVELTGIAGVQTRVDGRSPHVVWLDEEAGLLLCLKYERARKALPEGRASVIRVPLRSADCNRILAQLTSQALRRLADPAAYGSRARAHRDLDAVYALFRVQVARMRLEHDGPAGIDAAIRAQIAAARDEHEAARRRAFRGWYLRRTFLEEGGAEGAAAALGHDAAEMAQVMEAWREFRAAATAHLGEHVPRYLREPKGDRHRIRNYYEFRTVGRSLTTAESELLKDLVRNAGRADPDLLIIDLLIDPYRDETSFDPDRLFSRFFDAGLFFDQSGHRDLWLRLPPALAGPAAPYHLPGYVEITATDQDVLVKMSRIEEDGELTYMHTDPGPWLAELLPLIPALAAGDLRPLHLAWTASAAHHHSRSRLTEPPAPPGLDEPPPELAALDRFLTEIP